MSVNKLAVPISDQPYYDDSPIGAIKDWHVGLDSRARGTANISGVCTTDTADKLTYATGGFTANVTVGDIVYNSTDDVYAFVTAIDSDTVLSLDWDAFPDGDELFEIYTPTTPGYGWNRLDTDLTVDDPSSPYYGLTIKAQKAKITEGYDTGWIQETNVNWANKSITVTHDLNLPVEDLIVEVWLAQNDDPTFPHKIITHTYTYDSSSASNVDNNRGVIIIPSSNNEFIAKTGDTGLHIWDSIGDNVILNQNGTAAYRFKVYRKQDVGIIPIIKTKAGLGVLSSLSVDSLTVNGQDVVMKQIMMYRKKIGEFFYTDTYEAPSQYNASDPESFFPALCLDTIEGQEDISSENWPYLVDYLREKKFSYREGKTSSKSDFDVTDWDITSNVVTLTFANDTAENAMLSVLAEDNLVHGDFNDWRSITLPEAIGDVDAGEYAITDIDTAARTIKFSLTASNNSGSGTFTVNFYQHRIPGSTTTARVYEATARSLVSANDSDGEAIAGLRRRDRMQGHWHYGFGLTVGTDTWDDVRGRLGPGTATSRFGAAAAAEDEENANGTPRTGDTTDPRSLIGHLYMWGQDFVE